MNLSLIMPKLKRILRQKFKIVGEINLTTMLPKKEKSRTNLLTGEIIVNVQYVDCLYSLTEILANEISTRFFPIEEQAQKEHELANYLYNQVKRYDSESIA